MDRTTVFNQLRRLVDERRTDLLDLSLALYELEDEHQKEAKAKLVTALAADEFKNDTSHEEHQPG